MAIDKSRLRCMLRQIAQESVAIVERQVALDQRGESNR
jgi:hypothetical protein